VLSKLSGSLWPGQQNLLEFAFREKLNKKFDAFRLLYCNELMIVALSIVALTETTKKSVMNSSTT
jgi:hypothetical protein